MPRNPGKPTIQELRAAQTHCIHGHKFTPENTYIATNNKYPKRKCRECHRIRQLIRRNRR